MLHDYSSIEATESGSCSNAECQSAMVLADPPSGSESNFPTYVVLSSDVPEAIIRYTIDGTEPDSLSAIYTEPILIASAGVVLKALAHTADCPVGPIATVQYTNSSFPFSFSYICDTPDYGGRWFEFTPNGNNDHHWQLQFTLSALTTIKRLELYQLDTSGNWTTGQVWSTNNPINPWPDHPTDEFECFPLLVFSAAVQVWVAYQSSLGAFGAGSYTWDLYGDTVIAAGGLFRLDIILSDDTKLSQTIIAECVAVPPPPCPPPDAPTVTGKCGGKVDVTFTGTVGRDYVIYKRSDVCFGEGWDEAASGTIDVSPKTVELSGLVEGCPYQFYVAIDELGCGLRDSNSSITVIPLLSPAVTISTDKTIVDPGESFTISWTSRNIGGAVCGGCLSGQVSIDNSIGCKNGNTPGSQAQSQAVCGIYTYQITGCNGCGTAIATVQVEVRCAALCPCVAVGPGSGAIMPLSVTVTSSPLSFLCPVDDWCCKSPVVCGPSNCGPGPAYFPSDVGGTVWNGQLFLSSPCGIYRHPANQYGGCQGAPPAAGGTLYPISVIISCNGSHWTLQVVGENRSSAGCFGEWWTGIKTTGNLPTGVYTRVSGCSPHPSSITVT